MTHFMFWRHWILFGDTQRTLAYPLEIRGGWSPGRSEGCRHPFSSPQWDGEMLYLFAGKITPLLRVFCSLVRNSLSLSVLPLHIVYTLNCFKGQQLCLVLQSSGDSELPEGRTLAQSAWFFPWLCCLIPSTCRYPIKANWSEYVLLLQWRSLDGGQDVNQPFIKWAGQPAPA